MSFIARWSIRGSHRVDYCHEVLRRLSNRRFVPRAELIGYARRLARKHSNSPRRTLEHLLRAPWFYKETLGALRGEPILDEWQLGFALSPNVPFCRLPHHARCRVCHGAAFVADANDVRPTCDSEW